MEKTVLLSSAYLPPVSYFSKLYAYEKVCVERFDHYMKQSYRNRCVIASAVYLTTATGDMYTGMRLWQLISKVLFSIITQTSFMNSLRKGIHSCSISTVNCATGYANSWMYIRM